MDIPTVPPLKPRRWIRLATSKFIGLRTEPYKPYTAWIKLNLLKYRENGRTCILGYVYIGNPQKGWAQPEYEFIFPIAMIFRLAHIAWFACPTAFENHATVKAGKIFKTANIGHYYAKPAISSRRINAFTPWQIKALESISNLDVVSALHHLTPYNPHLINKKNPRRPSMDNRHSSNTRSDNSTQDMERNQPPTTLKQNNPPNRKQPPRSTP